MKKLPPKLYVEHYDKLQSDDCVAAYFKAERITAERISTDFQKRVRTKPVRASVYKLVGTVIVKSKVETTVSQAK